MVFKGIKEISKIRHKQKRLKVKWNATKGECIPCNTSQCLSHQQIIATKTFESTQAVEMSQSQIWYMSQSHLKK